MVIKPITTDFRTGENQDLYEYVLAYAKKHCGGKLAPAIISIVRDHKEQEMQRSVLIVQGDRIISKS